MVVFKIFAASRYFYLYILNIGKKYILPSIPTYMFTPQSLD